MKTIKRAASIKLMDISTIHITEKDNELLLADVRLGNENRKSIVEQLHYGYIVYVPEASIVKIRGCCNSPKELKKLGYSKYFIDIMENAINQNFGFIKFDAEGIQYEDLEKFEW